MLMQMLHSLLGEQVVSATVTPVITQQPNLSPSSSLCRGWSPHESPLTSSGVINHNITTARKAYVIKVFRSQFEVYWDLCLC